MNDHEYIIKRMIDIFSSINWDNSCDVNDVRKILKRFLMDYDTNFSSYPRIGIAAQIEKDGKVLLLQRNNGEWSFPGGKLEKNEDLDDCIKREVKEETNLDVISLERIEKVTNDKFDDIHYITLYYKCEVEGEPINKEPDKCKDIKWFSWDEIPSELFLPMKNFLK